MKKYIMRLNALKSTSGVELENFLRFLITLEGTKINLDMAKVILDMQSPKMIMIVDWFIG